MVSSLHRNALFLSVFPRPGAFSFSRDRAESPLATLKPFVEESVAGQPHFPCPVGPAEIPLWPGRTHLS
jgi:hypothetical protein